MCRDSNVVRVEFFHSGRDGSMPPSGLEAFIRPNEEYVQENGESSGVGGGVDMPPLKTVVKIYDYTGAFTALIKKTQRNERWHSRLSSTYSSAQGLSKRLWFMLFYLFHVRSRNLHERIKSLAIVRMQEFLINPYDLSGLVAGDPPREVHPYDLEKLVRDVKGSKGGVLAAVFEHHALLDNGGHTLVACTWR